MRVENITVRLDMQETRLRKKNVRKAPDRTFQIEDSMLNAPTQPVQTKILISDKDIPNIYVTKLDSTLHLYETELDQRIMPCASDSNFVELN